MAQRMDAESRKRDLLQKERRYSHSSRSRPASPGFGTPASAYQGEKSPAGFRVLSAIASPMHSRPSSPFAHFDDEGDGSDANQPMDTSLTTQELLEMLLQSAQDTMAQQSKSIVRDLLHNCCEDVDRFLLPKHGNHRNDVKVDWTHPTLSDIVDIVGRLIMVVFTLKEEVKIGPNTTKSIATSQAPGVSQANSRASSRPASPIRGPTSELVTASKGEKPGVPRPAWGISYSAKVRQHRDREKKAKEVSKGKQGVGDLDKSPKPKDRAKPKEPERRWMP
ncbi:hypothetical protein BCR44DRAFT_331602 [Catenaria anguillulae PL171]|uniref:Uncharacterized protein n=1 Tax=Catenaria anguillulae PL171 TaxID=765915 RepID=A0A1Y2HQ56_9FUNG|nr:hypothetical protein BCR44DRAFT_331602 [Catenaria anguillulae PL171]